jgi:hypothetical protein
MTLAMTDPVKFYLVRLLAPRPTFMSDMTEEERDIMGRHAEYWRGLLERGTAIVFGPVADPKGGWGVGIVRVPDEAAVHALRDGDPVISSARGFSYEILPMLRAVYRG